MLEQMYNDFTTKLLPTIQEGLAITKDYFLDLFGRYIKYLIISDSFKALFLLGALILSLTFLVKAYNSPTDRQWKIVIWTYLALIMFMGFAMKVDDIFQDIFVPEVRIYEKIQVYRLTN